MGKLSQVVLRKIRYFTKKYLNQKIHIVRHTFEKYRPKILIVQHTFENYRQKVLIVLHTPEKCLKHEILSYTHMTYL